MPETAKTIAERIDASGISRLKIVRASGVSVWKIYNSANLTEEEIERVEQALANLIEARRLTFPIGDPIRRGQVKERVA